MTLDLSLLPDGGVRWLDAAGAHSDVVLSCRVRLARNVDGYAFTGRARDGERLRVLVQVREALQVLPGLNDSLLVRIDELGPADRAMLWSVFDLSCIAPAGMKLSATEARVKMRKPRL